MVVELDMMSCGTGAEVDRTKQGVAKEVRSGSVQGMQTREPAEKVPRCILAVV
jgi:hypothetical protein